MEKKKSFSVNIIRWYKNHGRSYPWRRTTDPFRILVSEIMLQKTDANKVLSVYPAVIKKYRTPAAFAKANLRSLKKDIHLLGISDRARRLKSASKTILELHNGKVPAVRKELLHLLGVGDYIANAVLCFGFNKNVPLLDSNVIRVIKRVFSLESRKKRARTDKQLWQFAGSLVPIGKAVDYNRGILDFAAKVCTARNPKCQICPNKKICDYYLHEIASATSKANAVAS
jgi:A/G-specific adenine glycosylase